MCTEPDDCLLVFEAELNPLFPVYYKLVPTESTSKVKV